MGPHVTRQTVDLFSFYLAVWKYLKALVVHNQLKEYLTEHKIPCKHQSGFRQNHSTIVDVIDFIHENMDKSLLTGIAYVDLCKAFDTVNPSVLLKTVSWIGIQNTEWLWFENYLTSRYQQINHAGYTTNIAWCTPGKYIAATSFCIFY